MIGLICVYGRINFHPAVSFFMEVEVFSARHYLTTVHGGRNHKVWQYCVYFQKVVALSCRLLSTVYVHILDTDLRNKAAMSNSFYTL